jgi:hypothetical protein
MYDDKWWNEKDVTGNLQGIFEFIYQKVVYQRCHLHKVHMSLNMRVVLNAKTVVLWLTLYLVCY